MKHNNTVDQINLLIGQIAELNGTIKDIEIRGNEANNMLDSRDKLINDLSKLIGIQTTQREYGVVDINCNGIGIVTERAAVELELQMQADGKLGLAPVGSNYSSTDVQGGTLGGLFSLKNELIPNIHDQLDSMAAAIINEINKYHVQGVGSQGSFSELTGREMIDQNLIDFQPPVTDGKIYVRIIDQATGEITRSSIDVTKASDTLADIASRLDDLTGISASVVSGKLSIVAENGYKFDFLPGILTAPTTSTLTGTAVPALSGTYGGTTNQTFTCTVVGSGQTGLDSSLSIKVIDSEGNERTLMVGNGYSAADPPNGQKLEIADGIFVSFNSGTLNEGETFSIEALANSDTSGVLAAAGINAFFFGNDAASIKVNSEISTNPAKIATAIGPDMKDSNNILRMEKLGQQAWASLGNKTPADYLNGMITSLGQQISLRDKQHENLEGLIQNLSNQQDNISGIDINDQAAQMLVFQQMFQAMGKYIQTVKSSMDTLMSLISI